MEHIQTDRVCPPHEDWRGVESGEGCGGRRVGGGEYQVTEKANKDSKPENQEVIPTSPI